MGILNLGGTTKRFSLSSQAVGREHLFCLFHPGFCEFYCNSKHISTKICCFAAFAAMRACRPQLQTKEHPLWLK